jgi:uncharacterized protein YjiS (DUF1127 family)
MAQVLSQHTCDTRVETPTRFVLDTVRAWLTVWSERRALERLDERMLRDIGLDEGEARMEAARPLWDVPQHRLPTAM